MITWRDRAPDQPQKKRTFPVYRHGLRTSRLLQTADLRTEVADMRQTGPASWCVGIDEPEAPVLGLFVRDVAGLTSRHVWLPPAAPATPRADGEVPEEDARRGRLPHRTPGRRHLRRGDNHADNQILTAVLHKGLRATTVATRLNHLALSRSASGLVGRSGLRGARTTPDLLASFGLAPAS